MLTGIPLQDKYYLSAWLLILLFAIYSFILAINSQEGTPPSKTGNGFFPFLTDKPLTEDGYYMLTVSWNIAQGKGFTYNYDIRTTGVQPLATLVYSLPAFIVQRFGGDKYDFTRAVLILSSILQVIFAVCIYLLSCAISDQPVKGLYFLFSVCIVLFNFKVLLLFANGLETGLYLVLLSVFFIYWLNFKEAQSGFVHLIGLGLLSGLLLLCRLDSAVIVIAFYLLLLLSGRIKTSRLILIILTALIVYLPWQIYIWDVTGNILQSSARSQTGQPLFFDFQNKLEQYFTSVLQHLTPFLYTGNIFNWLIIPLGTIYLALFYKFYRKYNLKVVSASSGKIFKMIMISFLMLVSIYFFFSDAAYFYIRYLALIMILSFPVFVVVLGQIYIKYRIVRMVSMIVIVTAFIIQALLYLHSGKAINKFSARAGYVKNNFSEDVRVAAFQTGVAGYLCENIINLDGKMDNEALKSIASGNIESYIDKMNVDVLIEWKDFILILLNQEYLANHWDLFDDDIGDGRTVCYMRKFSVR
jgi:hypothetical protein